MNTPPVHSQLTENICLAPFSQKYKRILQFPNYNGHSCPDVTAGLICEETGIQIFELGSLHLNLYFTQKDLLKNLGMLGSFLCLNLN